MAQTLKAKGAPAISPRATDLPSGGLGAKELTYEQFLDREAENPHVEWVAGKVVEMAPVSDAHQNLGGFLHGILRAYVESHDLGAVRTDPFQMKSGPDLPGRAPDILFVAKKNLSRLKKNHLAGPADMVIEIVSPGSRAVRPWREILRIRKGGRARILAAGSDPETSGVYRRGKDGLYRPFRSTRMGHSGAKW